MKTYLSLAIMICSLIMALMAEDVVFSKLYASLGIITAAFVSSKLSDNKKLEE